MVEDVLGRYLSKKPSHTSKSKKLSSIDPCTPCKKPDVVVHICNLSIHMERREVWIELPGSFQAR